jgi:hypothetical protein
VEGIREQAGRARASVVRGGGGSVGWARGLAPVSKVTGLARSTINRGEDDLDASPLPIGCIRGKGGGRHALGDKDPGLREALRRLVDPDIFGDPMRPLVWVSKSLEKLATALTSMGFPVGIDTVRAELRKLGFSRQGNRKAEEAPTMPIAMRSSDTLTRQSLRRRVAESRSCPSTRRRRN